MDLGMMVLTRGGRERSRAEFERLLHDAGFELRSVISTTVFMSILVAELANSSPITRQSSTEGCISATLAPSVEVQGAQGANAERIVRF